MSAIRIPGRYFPEARADGCSCSTVPDRPASPTDPGWTTLHASDCDLVIGTDHVRPLGWQDQRTSGRKTNREPMIPQEAWDQAVDTTGPGVSGPDARPCFKCGYPEYPSHHDPKMPQWEDHPYEADLRSCAALAEPLIDQVYWDSAVDTSEMKRVSEETTGRCPCVGRGLDECVCETDEPVVFIRDYGDWFPEARAAAAANPRPEPARELHQPGDSHRYRIECEVCGQPGMVNLSVEPQRTAALASPAAAPATEPQP